MDAIGRVVDAVIRWHIWDQKGIHSLKATNIVTILMRVGAPLMMRINAAISAEIVLRGIRVELIETQDVCAFEYRDAVEQNRSNDSSLAPTDGAVAATWIFNSVWKRKLQHDRAAVAARLVFLQNGGVANLLDHFGCLGAEFQTRVR